MSKDDYIEAGEILVVRGEDEDLVLNPLREAGFKLCLVKSEDEFVWRWIIMKKKQVKS